MEIERARLIHNSRSNAKTALSETLKILQEENSKKPKKERLNISLKSLQNYKKQNKGGKWEVDPAKAELYDAIKLAEQGNIEMSYKPPVEQQAHQILSNKAKEEARRLEAIKMEIALLEMQDRQKARLLRSAMLDTSLAIVKGGSVTESDIETFDYEQGKLRSKTITRTKPITLKDIDPIKIMQGMGELQTTPTVAIQNNNNAEAKVENKTTEIPQISLAQEILANALPQHQINKNDDE